jgi:hypothetical protein
MPPKLTPLTERQRAVIATMRQKMSEEQAIAYLTEEGYPMGKSTWYRIKAFLKRTQLQRLHYIASIGFEQQHIARIETCEMIEHEMWKNYAKEESPFKRVIILEKIQNLQPLISSYYDTTRVVLEKTHQEKDNVQHQDTNSISKPAV